MECSIPPPLSDDQISAALDDTAESDLYIHIQHCPSCAQRLAQARQFDHHLQHTLFRVDCPTAQQLGDYHEGLVDPTIERSIINHLQQCQLCTAELEDLRIFVTGSGAQPAAQRSPQPAVSTWKARLGELVAHLRQPQMAPTLRGNAAGPIMAEAAGTTIILDVQPASSDQISLTGQIVADDQERWMGALVELHQAGAVRAVVVVDDLGSFGCTLPSGLTDLRITPEHGQAIVLSAVELAYAS